MMRQIFKADKDGVFKMEFVWYDDPDSGIADVSVHGLPPHTRILAEITAGNIVISGE